MIRVLFVCSILGLFSSTVYLLLALIAARRFRRESGSERQPVTELPFVSVLKPLHGMEPMLEGNLESFFRQDYPKFEIVFGARHKDDPALRIVEGLRLKYPEVKTSVVLSGEPEYPNAKIFALEKMVSAAGTYLVITDSDVHVSPDCLEQVVTPLLDSAVGVVTCLYRGVAAGGFWGGFEDPGMWVVNKYRGLFAQKLESMWLAPRPSVANRQKV